MNPVCRDITSCTPLKLNRRFGGTRRLHLSGPKSRSYLLHAGFLLDFQRNTQRYVQEARPLHTRRLRKPQILNRSYRTAQGVTVLGSYSGSAQLESRLRHWLFWLTYHGSPQSRRVNASVISRLLPFRFFPVHYSSIVPFDAMWSRYWQCHKICRGADKSLAFPVFLFAAQRKEFFLDGLKELEQRNMWNM
jgi:hypothetical protein